MMSQSVAPNITFQRTLAEEIAVVWGIFLMVFGTTGNLLTLIVISGYKSMKSSSRLLFSLLACIDQVVLLSGEVRYWIMAFSRTDIRNTSAAMCKFHTFFTVTFLNFSMWILCLISLERLFLTQFPLRKHPFDRIRNIGFLIIAVFFAMLVKSCFWLSRKYSNGKCGFLSVGDFTTISALNYTLGCGLPFAICLISTAILLWNVHKRKRRVSDDHGSGTSPKNDLKTTTIMLVVIVFVQLSIGSPGYIFSVLEDAHLFDGFDSHYINQVYVVLATFTVTNNAINFYAYMLSAKGFRRQFLRLFHLRKDK